jgi:hypothetical protein
MLAAVSEFPRLQPRQVAPYFIVVALIHIASVATRFDLVAAKVPNAAEALMIAQFPLLFLSGYFEGRIDYGAAMENFPLWMRIKSRPVKLAFTFAFIYLTLVAAQTWHVSIGPLDPTPPDSFPQVQRALWFTMFSAGMFFPFYLAATSILIPLLRFLTRPLRALPTIVGALLALAIGAGLGLLVFAAVTSTQLGAFVESIHQWIQSDPAIALAVTLGVTLGPMFIGMAFGKED